MEKKTLNYSSGLKANMGLNISSLLIYALSAVYILFVFYITRFYGGNNVAIYVIYFIMAVPFINHLDKYVLICYVLSTIAYYFIGADEAIWSIYSIFAVLALIKTILNQKIRVQKTFPFLMIIAATIISYTYSEFHYLNGAILLVYNIVISIIILNTITFDEDTLTNFLPFLACIQIVLYGSILLTAGFNEAGRLSISNNVDFNTFGMAVAQMCVILGIKIFILKGSHIIYRIIWILGLIIVILSSSRNALLGVGAATIIVYFVNIKREGHALGNVFKFVVFSFVLLVGALIFLPISGLDLTRFDYVELVQSGGTNRVTLWNRVIPVIIEKYNIFGYGPGHYTSSQIVSPLVNRNYAHTHNLIIEAWGELGLFGLIPFVWLLVNSSSKLIKKSKNNKYNLILLGIFIELMINSIGESHFVDIVLWIIIGFAWSYDKRRMED